MTATARPVAAMVPLADLHANPRNPRRISPERLDQLARALAADPDMLWARPLIATRDGVVIAGNQRLAAARQLGWQSMPAIVCDLDQERAALWALRDNQPYGEWEDDLLAELLAELRDASVDLDLTGFPLVDLERVLGEPDFPRMDGTDVRLDERQRVTCPACGEVFTP